MTAKELTPFPYQARLARQIVRVRRCALWLPMGMGKTIAVLLALLRLFDTAQVGRVLVISTPRIIHRTWPKEIERWTAFRHMSYKVLDGPNWREQMRSDRSQIHLISFDALANRRGPKQQDGTYPVLFGAVGLWGVKHWPYDCVVIDEASKLKDSGTRRFKALRRVIHQKVDTVIEMTGTPSPEGLYGLWSQLWLLDGGRRLGSTKKAFEDRWWRMPSRSSEWEKPVLRPGAERNIHEQVVDNCFALDPSEYVRMPKRIDNIIEVDMPDSAWRVYKRLQEEMYVSLLEGDVVAANAGVLTSKLRQVANGFAYLEPIDEDYEAQGRRAKKYRVLHSAKLDALEDIIEEAEGEPVVVAFQFIADVERILARIPHARLLSRSTKEIDDLTARRIQVLLMHPASAGHGIDGLQEVCSQLVFYGRPPSLEQYLQTIGRLERTGQRRRPVIHTINIPDTADDVVMMGHRTKRRIQDRLLEAAQQWAKRKRRVA